MNTAGNRDHPRPETIRLELSDGSSHKFYEVTIDDVAVTIRYGRIGTQGQSSSSVFATVDKAQSEATKKINEKLRKGYVQILPEARSPIPQPSNEVETNNVEPNDVEESPTNANLTSRWIDLATLPIETDQRRSNLRFSLQRPLVAIELSATSLVPTFTINLDITNLDTALDTARAIAYHFDVRSQERQIVQNTYIAGRWGSEERLPIPGDIASGQPFTLKITIEQMIIVSLNGQILSRYAHRLPSAQIDAIHIIYPPGNLQVQSVQIVEQIESEPIGAIANSAKASVEAPTGSLEAAAPLLNQALSSSQASASANPPVDPSISLPSIELLNVAPSAPPSIAKEHLRQLSYPSAFSFRENRYCSMSIPLPRSLMALEMVGTFNSLASSSFTLTLKAQDTIAYSFLFRPNEGCIIQRTEGDGDRAGEQRVSIPESVTSRQLFQLVIAITAKQDFSWYLNNQAFHYTPLYRPDQPIDQVILNYDTSGLKLQLFRGLEPRLALPTKKSRNSAPTVATSPPELPPPSQITDRIEQPHFLQELPPQFEPLRSFLKENLVGYIKIQATEVQRPRPDNAGAEWCYDPLEPWQSKIGGYPYLAKNMAYPVDYRTGQMMMFLMQINCADLPSLDGLSFPRQGLLQFYVGLDVPMCTLSPERHRVVYIPDISHDKNDLITNFSFLQEAANALEWYNEVYTLSFSLQQDVFWDARQWLDNTFKIPDTLKTLCTEFDEWIEEYEDRCSRYAQSEGGRQNKLGGYPELHSTVEETIDGVRGRLLLELQHESNCDDNFYFFIEEADLNNENFNSIEFYFLRN